MSTHVTGSPPEDDEIARVPQRRKRRRLWWNTAGAAVALAGIVGALVLWANSEQAQNLVRERLVSQIQNVTGGRVEMRSFKWRLMQLEFDARGIVIHGDEEPGEVPYAQVDDLRLKLSLLGLWSPRILLRDLEITRPRIHLIFYPDGATNQPRPTKKPEAQSSAMETLFKLQAGHVSLEQGLLDIDNRAAYLDVQNRYEPLDFRGNDVSVAMAYVPAAPGGQESYRIDAGVRDLTLARGGSLEKSVAPVHGYLQASADLMRDAVNLRSLRMTGATRGAPDRTLDVTGSLTHFARPEWRATFRGDLDLRLLDPVLGYPNAPQGIARIDLESGGQNGQFRIDGTVRVDQGWYIQPGVVVRGVDLSTKVHADQNELRISSIAARLAQGGEIDGDLVLDHWLPPGPATPVVEAAPDEQGTLTTPLRKKRGNAQHRAQPEQAPAKKPHSTLVKQVVPSILVNGTVNAQFRNVTLDTVLDIVSQPPFQRLGVDTLLNGPARAVWVHGDVNTLTVTSTLNMSPSGHAIANEAPASGKIDATYTQRDGSVDVRALELILPASHLTANGRLGAYPLTSTTALNVELETRNLGEFDASLRGLGLARNGRTGAAALPVALSGVAEFRGTWSGSLESPRLAGDLKATQVAVEMPPSMNDPAGKPRVLRWDSIVAGGSYAAEQIAIMHAQLKHGEAEISVDGTLSAAPVALAATPGRSAARGSEMPAFDENSVLHLHARAAKVDAADLMPLAGVDWPVKGLLDSQLTAEGPMQALRGSGWVQLNNGTVYDVPVIDMRAEGSFADDALNLTKLTARANAGTITGSGAFDLRTKRLKAEITGTGIELAKIEKLQATNADVRGEIGLHVTVTGTTENPDIEGKATAAGFAVRGESLGTVALTAHTTNHALMYDVTTQLDSAGVVVHGQTELRGDYATEAKLNFDRFDIATVLRLAHVQGIDSNSALNGVATISGPLAKPVEMRGDLRLQEMALTVEGVHLKSAGPVHAALGDEKVSLDPVHITGENTDLWLQGNVGLKDEKRLDLSASGSVNLRLAETLDPDVTAGGTATFQVEARGPIDNPGLRGRVEFKDGSLALEDLPNGLSQLHGELEFNQNRLEVRSLTAMTGGGQLSVGGYLAYQKGIFADLSVKGSGIRIRYPEGVSSEADTTLQLQGTPASMLLSGNVLLTRFSVSPDLDIAALANQATAAQTVVPPNAPSNRVRLDVRIRSSPQLNFQNAYAKLAGDVDLRLRGTVASPSLLGRVSITEGNATIAGTRYELQRGDITFTNPVRIQPTIDMTATARVEDYDITLGLHGTPEKMTASLRSDPPLPEADVAALLALGRTQSEQGLYTEQQQRSAGLTQSSDVLLGGALNATVSSRVQKLFGAGSVKVDPSYLSALGNSTTRITVEEQLGPYVTLTYATNVDTTAQQLIQGEIAINRHVSLQITRDESGVFSMVLKAVRRYR